MVTAFLAFAAMATPPLSLTPTADVWVYPHASDPERDSYLRVWGAGGDAVSADPGDAGDFSYSYLKWDVSPVPAGAKLKAATLVLTHTASPTFTLDQARLAPLEARTVSADFEEKGWTYEKSVKIAPDKGNDAIFGAASPDSLGDAKDFTITIDLMKGPNDFRAYFAKAIEAKQLALALTSRIDPSEGQRSFYKVYSKDTQTASQRPSLNLTFE